MTTHSTGAGRPWRATLLIGALCVAATSCGADPGVAEVEDPRPALILARDAVWRAYFGGDSAKLVELLPDTMVAMGKHRADIIRDAQAFVADSGRFLGIRFSDDEFYVRGDVALVFSRYEVNLTRRGKPAPMSGRAIELFEKRNGRWINPSWHLDDDQP